jgi:hypothetical protein
MVNGFVLHTTSLGSVIFPLVAFIGQNSKVEEEIDQL